MLFFGGQDAAALFSCRRFQHHVYVWQVASTASEGVGRLMQATVAGLLGQGSLTSYKARL